MIKKIQYYYNGYGVIFNYLDKDNDIFQLENLYINGRLITDNLFKSK
jgi:hypothetical protein